MAEKTKAQEKYAEYLASDEWKEIRDKAIERSGGRCQVCNGTKELNVHHRTYKGVPCFESDGDLTVLCRTCHALFHGKTTKAEKERAMAEGEAHAKDIEENWTWGAIEAIGICFKHFASEPYVAIGLILNMMQEVIEEVREAGEEGRGYDLSQTPLRKCG